MNDTTDWYEVDSISEHAYRIVEAERYGIYLIEGEDQSLVIDAGIGVGNLPELVTNLVDAPPTLLLTHGHWDHIGSAADFETVLIHENDLSPDGRLTIDARSDEFVRRPEQFVHRWRNENNAFPDTFSPESYTIDPVSDPTVITDGDQISLGDRTIELIHTPGHAPGHVVALDRNSKDLYGGDVIHSNSGLYVHFVGCDVNVYHDTFERLAGLRDDNVFNRLLTSHNPPFESDSLSIIDTLRDGLAGIADDSLEFTLEQTEWGSARNYDIAGSPVLTTDPPQ